MAKAVPKTSARSQFVTEVANQTGLNRFAIYLWSNNSTGGLTSPSTAKDYNYLGLTGKSLSGVATTTSGYSTIKDAATEASYRINHLAKYSKVKASAGKNQNTQFTAIENVLSPDLLSLVTGTGKKLASAKNIQDSGKTSFGLGDLTVANPVKTTEDLVNSTVKKVMYAFAVLGGGLLAIMGLVLIGVDVGISELNKSKGVRTLTETAGIGGAILKAGGSKARAERSHAKSEKRYVKVRRATETKTNKQMTKRMKAGKSAVPKTEGHKLTDQEKADRSQIRKSSQNKGDVPY